MSKTKGTKSAAQPMNHTDVARALRAASPEMDELRQLRLERRVLASTEQGVGAPSSAASSEVLPMRRVLPPARLTLGVLALAAAALLGYLLRGGVAETSTNPLVEGAHFSLVRAEGTTDGVLAQGANVATHAGERGSVEVGDVTAHLAERTNLSLESDDAEDVAMRLESGSTEFAFHPHQRGAQHLTVTTPNARVEVVGTVFTVRVDGAGTEVSVSEGTVRVVRLSGGAASLVHAGDTLMVRSVTTSARAGAVASPAPRPMQAEAPPASGLASIAASAPTTQLTPMTERAAARVMMPSALREAPTALTPSPTVLTQAPVATATAPEATVPEATATDPTLVETPSAAETPSAPEAATPSPEALALAAPRRSRSRGRTAPSAATALASPRAPRPEVVTRGPQLSQPRTAFAHERRVWGRVDDLQSNGQYEQSLPLLIAIENEGAPADRAEALYHRARTLDVALHRPAQAVALYRRYLEAHPTGVRAREAEQRIRMIERQ